MVRLAIILSVSLIAFAVCLPRIATSAPGDEIFTNTGLYGGRVNDLAIDPTNPDKMFAGTSNGDGLFVSSDAGNNWTPVVAGETILGEDTFKNHIVWDVDIAPSDPNIIWVAHNYWVEKSIDGGETWQHIMNTWMQVDTGGPPEDNFRFCLSVAIHPEDPDIVYVGTAGPQGTYLNGAIYKTTNGGVAWEKVTNIKGYEENDLLDFELPIYDIEIDPVSGNVWAVARSENSDGKLYRYDSAGDYWIEEFHANAQFFDLEVKPHGASEPSELYLATAYGLAKIYFAPSLYNSLHLRRTDPEWLIGDWNIVQSVSIPPSNPNMVYAVYYKRTDWGGDGIGRVAKSLDGGDSWEVYDAHEIFDATAVHPDNHHILYAGHMNRGVRRLITEHGEEETTWTMATLNDGLTAARVFDIDADHMGGGRLLVGTRPGLYAFDPDGMWVELLTKETKSVAVDPDDNQKIYAGIDGHLAKSVSGGLSWDFIAIPDNGGSNYISDISIDPQNTQNIYIAVNYFEKGGAIHKSSDGGVTFVKVLDGLNGDGETVPFNAVAVDPGSPNRILAGSGLFYAPGRNGDLWISENGGVDWVRTSLQDVIVNALAFNPDNPNMVYAGCGYSGQTSTPVLVSTNGGIDWLSASEGISDEHWNAATDLAFDSNDTSIIYVSTLMRGIYVRRGVSRPWLAVGTPDGEVYAIGVSTIVAGTERGMFQMIGTGVIAGVVQTASTNAALNGAVVSNDLGARSTTIAGEYLLISPVGICSVTAAAAGHETTTIDDVTVSFGAITYLDIQLSSGTTDSATEETDAGDQNSFSDTSSGGGACFIRTADTEYTSGWGPAIISPELIRSQGWAEIIIFLAFFALVRKCWRFKISHKRTKSSGCPAGVVAVLGLLCVFVVPDQKAHAGTIYQRVGISGSPNPIGSGARAQGMGGAFIAVADDATAASWNPAGLIQLERPEMSLVVGYQHFEESITSQSHPEVDSTGSVSGTQLNYLSVTLPYHWHRNVVVSINYQRLYEFGREFNLQFNFADAVSNLVQNKSYEQDGYVAAVGLAAAIEMTPKFSFGLTVNLWTDQLVGGNGWTETFVERSTGIQGGSPVTIDTHAADEYSEFRGINVNVGLLYSPVQSLTIGAVIKTPFTASLLHEHQFRQTQIAGPPTNTTTSSSQTLIEDVELELPLSYGVGVAWRLSDALTVAADVYRTHWSDYILEDDQGNRFSPIDGNFESGSNVDDTTQYRFGIEYLIIQPEKGYTVPLRMGFYYDPEPGSDDTKAFYGLSIGSGFAWNRMVLDFSYNYRWGDDVDASNLIPTAEVDVTQHTVLASLIYHFK